MSDHCDDCPDHKAHKTTLDYHEKRLDGHDTELGDVKKSFATALKSKLPRWVFISAATVLICVLGGVLGYQTTTLISIDKKVAVLYDREEMRKKAAFTIKPEVKPYLVMASSLQRCK